MLRRFGPNDIVLNTMVATPRVDFFVWNSYSYFNQRPSQVWSDRALNTNQVDLTPKTGYVNLYEYNIGRTSGAFDSAWHASVGDSVAVGPYPAYSAGDAEGFSGTGIAAYPDGYGGNGKYGIIYPYLSKDSARASFKTAVGGETIEGITPSFYNNEFAWGDILSASYPQNCTITRELIPIPSASTAGTPGTVGNYNRHYVSLKNLLEVYGVKSRHYQISSSADPSFDKNKQTLNLIHIPSLFYGTRIRPGTLSLRWYVTGSLAAELRDTKRNGELIQVSGSSTAKQHDGKVAGVVLYDEGFIVLTGSWSLNDGRTISLDSGSFIAPFEPARTNTEANNKRLPSWIFWGAGMNDGVTRASTLNTVGAAQLTTASFGLNFEGQTKTQVMTLYTHARRGQVNYSNNPSFIKHGQAQMKYTSSHVYEENPNRLMKNTVSSAFGSGAIASGFTASFQRQVYISKIAVYDKDKNLIGMATLGSPVLKKEDEDLTFKLKMDF